MQMVTRHNTFIITEATLIFKNFFLKYALRTLQWFHSLFGLYISLMGTTLTLSIKTGYFKMYLTCISKVEFYTLLFHCISFYRASAPKKVSRELISKLTGTRWIHVPPPVGTDLVIPNMDCEQRWLCRIHPIWWCWCAYFCLHRLTELLCKERLLNPDKLPNWTTKGTGRLFSPSLVDSNFVKVWLLNLSDYTLTSKDHNVCIYNVRGVISWPA